MPLEEFTIAIGDSIEMVNGGGHRFLAQSILTLKFASEIRPPAAIACHKMFERGLSRGLNLLAFISTGGTP
jgi:hypothetical protein